MKETAQNFVNWMFDGFGKYFLFAAFAVKFWRMLSWSKDALVAAKDDKTWTGASFHTARATNVATGVLLPGYLLYRRFYNQPITTAEKWIAAATAVSEGVELAASIAAQGGVDAVKKAMKHTTGSRAF